MEVEGVKEGHNGAEHANIKYIIADLIPFEEIHSLIATHKKEMKSLA